MTERRIGWDEPPLGALASKLIAHVHLGDIDAEAAVTAIHSATLALRAGTSWLGVTMSYNVPNGVKEPPTV